MYSSDGRYATCATTLSARPKPSTTRNSQCRRAASRRRVRASSPNQRSRRSRRRLAGSGTAAVYEAARAPKRRSGTPPGTRTLNPRIKSPCPLVPSGPAGWRRGRLTSGFAMRRDPLVTPCPASCHPVRLHFRLHSGAPDPRPYGGVVEAIVVTDEALARHEVRYYVLANPDMGETIDNPGALVRRVR